MAKKIAHSLSTLIAFIVFNGIIGGVYVLFMMSSVDTERILEISRHSYLTWILVPASTILFALSGVALYQIWIDTKAKKFAKLETLIIFGILLVMGFYWTIISFVQRNPTTAYFQIFFLFIALLATIISFALISKKSVYFLFPYFLWVCFAGYFSWNLYIEAGMHANIFIHPTACTQETKKCADGSSVQQRGSYCLFDPCPNRSNEEQPYPDYSIVEESETFCILDTDCTVSGDYLLRSNCPYVPKCINDRCAVVCPKF